MVVLGVPAFPRHLEDKLRIAEAGGHEDEAKQFLTWWADACARRGYTHGRGLNAEEWVHARRLLTKHTFDQLKSLAVDYFIEFARHEWRGPQLLRMFWSMLPEVEAQAKRHG